MKLSNQIKPISYLKAHAAEIVHTLGVQREPLIITQNGEAKVVVQDIDSYEQTQETGSLLKILALGSRQIEASQVQPAADVIRRLRGGVTHAGVAAEALVAGISASLHLSRGAALFYFGIGARS